MAGMASLMEWAGTWANSGRRSGTERPGMLQSIGSQRVRHNSGTEQQLSGCCVLGSVLHLRIHNICYVNITGRISVPVTCNIQE